MAGRPAGVELSCHCFASLAHHVMLPSPGKGVDVYGLYFVTYVGVVERGDYYQSVEL